jgi:hypothetical protein
MIYYSEINLSFDLINFRLGIKIHIENKQSSMRSPIGIHIGTVINCLYFGIYSIYSVKVNNVFNESVTINK